MKLACGLSRLREVFKFSFSTSRWSSNFISLLATSSLWVSKSAATRLPRLLEVLVGIAGGFNLPSCFPFLFVLGVASYTTVEAIAVLYTDGV